MNPMRHALVAETDATFRHLYRLLARAPLDETTIARWQSLYRLGTRLYRIKNEAAAGAQIPIFEVNGHHMSVPYWIEEGLRRPVGPLLHFDSHADMSPVPSYAETIAAIHDLRRGQNVKDAWHTIAHTINQCTMPVTAAVMSGVYPRVIWAKPSEIPEETFLNRQFFFAVRSTHPPRATNHDANPSVPTSADTMRKPSYRLYYDDAQDLGRGLPALNASVYWDRVSSTTRKDSFKINHPFIFIILKGDLDIDVSGRGVDAKAAQQFLDGIPQGVFTLDLDLDFFGSIDTSMSFMRSAGTQKPWNSAQFKKERAILSNRLQRFQKLLSFLKKHRRIPALITIADSTFFPFAYDELIQGQSEFTPIEHAAFIKYEVLKILRNVYGNLVHTHHPQHH
ncbi:MAG: hypothetical protein VX589_01280 [Myxococcota bacterium]|nr:hypothetical protein [Myxococcota bacterium]